MVVLCVCRAEGSGSISERSLRNCMCSEEEKGLTNPAVIEKGSGKPCGDRERVWQTLR